MLKLNGWGAPKTASERNTADCDLIAAPGTGKQALVSTINCDVTVAEGTKNVIVAAGALELAQFSLAAVGSMACKIFDPPILLDENTALTANTNGTSGEFLIVVGYYDVITT